MDASYVKLDDQYGIVDVIGCTWCKSSDVDKHKNEKKCPCFYCVGVIIQFSRIPELPLKIGPKRNKYE